MLAGFKPWILSLDYCFNVQEQGQAWEEYKALFGRLESIKADVATAAEKKRNSSKRKIGQMQVVDAPAEFGRHVTAPMELKIV